MAPRFRPLTEEEKASSISSPFSGLGEFQPTPDSGPTLSPDTFRSIASGIGESVEDFGHTFPSSLGWNFTDEAIQQLPGEYFQGLGDRLQEGTERARERGSVGAYAGDVAGAVLGGRALQKVAGALMSPVASMGGNALKRLMQNPIVGPATQITGGITSVTASETGRGEGYGDKAKRGTEAAIGMVPFLGGPEAYINMAIPAASMVPKAYRAAAKTAGPYIEMAADKIGMSPDAKRTVANVLRSQDPPSFSRAQGEIGESLYEAGYTPEEVRKLARDVQDIGDLGVPMPVGASTMKVSGRAARGRLEQDVDNFLVTQSAGSKTIIDEMQQLRQNRERMYEALNEIAPKVGKSKAADDAAEALSKNYLRLLEEPAGAAKPIYDEIESNYPLLSNSDGSIDRLFKERPALDQTYSNLREISEKYQTGSFPDAFTGPKGQPVPFNQLDKVQKALGDQERSLKKAIAEAKGGEKAKSFQEELNGVKSARKALTDLIDEKTGGLYKQAQLTWLKKQQGNRADVKTLRGAMRPLEYDPESGEVFGLNEPSRFLKGLVSTPDGASNIARILKDNSPLRSAFRETIEDNMLNRVSMDPGKMIREGLIDETSSPGNWLQKPENRETLRTLAPEAYKNLVARMMGEQRIAELDNFITGSSQTPARAMGLLKNMGGKIARFAVNPYGAAAGAIYEATSGIQSPKAREELARALMSYGDEGAATLNKAADYIEQLDIDEESASYIRKLLAAQSRVAAQ